jgi:hypothetical protein
MGNNIANLGHELGPAGPSDFFAAQGAVLLGTGIKDGANLAWQIHPVPLSLPL